MLFVVQPAIPDSQLIFASWRRASSDLSNKRPSRQRSKRRVRIARPGCYDHTNMHYIDSFTGVTYPLSEPRWRGDSGGYLNLGDAPGLTRAQIDASVNSLWRYREALLVDTGDADSGRGVDTPRARPVGRHSRSDEARLPDAERLVQGPRHDRDGHLSEEAWRRRRAGGFVGQCWRIALDLLRRRGHALPRPSTSDRVVSKDRADRRLRGRGGCNHGHPPGCSGCGPRDAP